MPTRLMITVTAAALVVASGSGAAYAAGEVAAPASGHVTVCRTHHQFFDGLTAAHRKGADRTKSNPWAVRRVRCEGRWAVASVTEGKGHEANAYTALEHHTTRHGWHELDRTRPCAAHRVPKGIYRYACESN